MKKIIYVTTDSERALGVENLLDDYHIICTDDNQITRGLQQSGVDVFSLEQSLGKKNPIFRNSARLLSHPETKSYLSKIVSDPANTYFMTFKISPQFERAVEEIGGEILNTNTNLNRKFENKLSQLHFLKEVGVTIPYCLVSKMEDVKIEELLSKYKKIVLQFDRGHTGESTFFLSSKEDFEKHQNTYPKREVKVAAHIEGEAWTVNGVISRFGINYGGLSYQITGQKELTQKEGATVGNDWTKTNRLSKDQIRKIEDILKKVGEGMKKDGYKGLFGLDFIINDNDVYLIEINARQPASTGVHTQFMVEDKQVPLILLHIAEFTTKNRSEFLKLINTSLNKNFDEDSLANKLKNQNSKLGQPIPLSQFLIRNKHDEPITISEQINSGIYLREKLIDPDAFKVDQIKDRESFLLLTANRRSQINSSNEIARIVARRSVLSGEGKIAEEFQESILRINESSIESGSLVLPEAVNEFISRYKNLHIGSEIVTAPYYINIKRVRAGLRSLIGKGTPDEIEEEALIYMKLRGFSLDGRNEKEIRDFMQSQGIGIECSGFVSHVLDRWLKESGMGNLSNFIQLPEASFMRKIISKIRYIENIGANHLTSSSNSRKIKIREVKPGDLIRLRGAKRGYHVALISKVKYDESKQVEYFEYTHSTPHYGDRNGVRVGKVEIKDIDGELRDQNWLEYDQESGKNWTYEGLLKEYEDNGLRRLNFFDQLEW